jgi:hypothetical protein
MLMEEIKCWDQAIYKIIDNTNDIGIEQKRKMIKNKYYTDHHHFYVVTFDAKEYIVIIHKENEELFNKEELFEIIASKQEKQVTEMKLKKFW